MESRKILITLLNYEKTKKMKYIVYLILLSTIITNRLQANNDVPGITDSIYRAHFETAVENLAGNNNESLKSIAFQKMHLGLFIHYTFAGKPYQWGSTLWADTSKVTSLDELADNLDVKDLVATAESMGAQYLVFTTFHANMNVLYPSAVMKSHLPGHCSKRDVIQDLINALKAKNIKLLLYIHPSDGHDFTREDQDRTGWNDGAPYLRWNNFINDLLGELADRYGRDISGYFVDGGLPEQVDAARLRKSIIERNPESWIIQNSGNNPLCADFSANEDNMLPPFPSTSWVRCQRISGEWWAKVNNVTFNPEMAYRYTVFQATVSNREGGGTCWSCGPHPGGRWEPGVRTFFKDLGSFIDKAGETLFGTRPGKAYISREGQPLLGTQYVATESPDGKKTYLHVFLPPKGQKLELRAPADKRRFKSARLFSSNHTIGLLQTETAVFLTLKSTDRWDDLDTIIVLE